MVINNLQEDSTTPDQKHSVPGQGTSCHLANDCAIDRRRLLGKKQNSSSRFLATDARPSEDDDEWQGRKLLASRDHSDDDDDDDEYALSCAIDCQAAHNLLRMAPLLWDHQRTCLCSQPVFDCGRKDDWLRYNVRFSALTGPDRNCAEFNRLRHNRRMVSEVGDCCGKAAAVPASRTFSAVDCGMIRGWAPLRAVSKSAPDVSLRLCQPFLCYSRFLELGWNRSGGGRCSDCRNRRKAFRRSSTIDSIRSPQMGGVHEMQRTFPSQTNGSGRS